MVCFFPRYYELSSSYDQAFLEYWRRTRLVERAKGRERERERFVLKPGKSGFSIGILEYDSRFGCTVLPSFATVIRTVKSLLMWRQWRLFSITTRETAQSVFPICLIRSAICRTVIYSYLLLCSKRVSRFGFSLVSSERWLSTVRGN